MGNTDKIKSTNQIVEESYDYMSRSAQCNPLLAQDFDTIVHTPALLEEYTSQLSKGCTATEQTQLKSLLQNNAKEILSKPLSESYGGISAISMLGMPVIRKLWMKFAMKEAIKTIVAEKPQFSLIYTRPWVRGMDGIKHYLPEAGVSTRKNGARKRSILSQKPAVEGYSVFETFAMAGSHELNLCGGTGSGINSISIGADQNITTGAEVDKYTGSNGKSVAPDFKDFEIVGVVISVKSKNADTTFTTVNSSYSLNMKLNAFDQNSKIIDIDEFPNGAAKRRMTVTAIVFNKDLGALSLSYNLSGTAYSLPADTTAKIAFKVKAPINTEMNDYSVVIGQDYDQIPVTIPAGNHMNTELPIEELQDLSALYAIDATKEAIDNLTKFSSQALDLELIEHLDNYYAAQDPETIKKNSRAFPVRPDASFDGSPSAWAEELKRVIDYVATEITTDQYLSEGKLVVVGSPMDTRLIHNIQWTSRNGSTDTAQGVDSNYSLGYYDAAFKYLVVSTPLASRNELTIHFQPSDDRTITTAYFPYTFNVEHGYRSSQNSNVPSIMMTKRHSMVDFLPAIGKVFLIGNDGQPYGPSLSKEVLGIDGQWRAPEAI